MAEMHAPGRADILRSLDMVAISRAWFDARVPVPVCFITC